MRASKPCFIRSSDTAYKILELNTQRHQCLKSKQRTEKWLKNTTPIKSSFRERASKRGEEKFRKVQEAYEQLQKEKEN